MFSDSVIRAVLTDVGNVVFPVHDDRCLRTLATCTGYDIEELNRMLRVGPHVSARVDSGYWKMRDLFQCTLAPLQRYLSWEQFRDAWQSMLGEDYPDVRSALQSLPPDIPLFTITNTNDLHLEYLKRHWLFRRSRSFWASCEIGMVKPRPEIYEFIIRAIGLPPSQILYFDDDPANCQTGREMGLRTVQVIAPHVVPDTLHRLSVLAA
jgi:putative hydrolase of the HAD superfamily